MRTDGLEECVPSGRLAEPLKLGRKCIRIYRKNARTAVGQRRRRGQRCGDVLQPLATQLRPQLGPEGTADEDGMHRRPAIVMEAWCAEFNSPYETARLCHLLEQDDAAFRIEEVRGGDEGVVACTDEDDVRFHRNVAHVADLIWCLSRTPRLAGATADKARCV